MHLGRLDDLRPINMADPFSALSVAQFFLSLEPHFDSIYRSISFRRDALVEGVQVARLQRWKIDSCIAAESCGVQLSIEERIIEWLEGLVDEDDANQSVAFLQRIPVA